MHRWIRSDLAPSSEFPQSFRRIFSRGDSRPVQINVNATAVAQAFNGMTYIEAVIVNYVYRVVTGTRGADGREPVKMVTRARFNPNLKSSWFSSVMQVINNLTMLTVILTGAALIREREQGTVEHLLVMPVVPAEIMLSKSRPMASSSSPPPMSPRLVAQWRLQVHCRIHPARFWRRVLLCIHGRGARHSSWDSRCYDGAFGLLVIPELLVIGAAVGRHHAHGQHARLAAYLMKVISPTPHFVVFSQDVLYRGAGLSIVWPEILATAAIGGCLLRVRFAPLPQRDLWRLNEQQKASLLHEMAKHNAKHGRAMPCIDGGMRMAMCVERN